MRKAGIYAKKDLADVGGRSRGDCNRNQGPDADLMEHEFHGEKQSPDRSIESCRYSGSGSRRNKGNPLPRRHWYVLAKSRTKSRSDLNYWSFASDGTPTADGNRGCQRFNGGHYRPYNATVVIDRIHNLRNAVPLCFGREMGNQK